MQRRSSLIPQVEYPPQLPITAHVAQIKALLQKHQVLVIAGDTGSGKTTQLPKICLDAGYGVQGLIGHTQPRRLAARTVANRIAQELRVDLGTQVGFKVRFSESTGENTLLKVMTDGILLAEIRQDRNLSNYEVIILDEAHERSLNIDFLLGYLKQILPKRPDLRLIVTSATIDESAFARHFADAPILRISGRSYPVEVRYVEHIDNLFEQLAYCFEEIHRNEGHASVRDVLLFASGEREILDCTRFLRELLGERWEILPLYARLAAKEQARVFSASAQPRVVVATNVAETSLTVPSIGYVIDPGTARLSRYSYRSKLARLLVEPISQASATQRSGRCGRLAPGVCFRLYSEAEFVARPAFTEPEIHRSNLAAVVLQMRAFRLGDIRRFPFLDPPTTKAINDAERLLFELGALRNERLSKVGQKMARLPVDPRLARMLVAAADLGSLPEVLIVVSALASADPRERPLEKQAVADAAHEFFHDDKSDFMALLNIWNWAEQQRKALGGAALNRLLKRRFLSPLRMREWRSLHIQLLRSVRTIGLCSGAQKPRIRESGQKPQASYASIHRALISGSLSLLGVHDERGLYQGARGSQFRIFPGSAQHAHNPKWLIAAEITETTRVYARCVASVAPRWLESAGTHLLRRSHSEPHWDPKRGEAMIFERTLLYGLTLAERRLVRLEKIDPEEARLLFIRDGLLAGGLTQPPEFLSQNLALVRELLDLEARGRRRDLLASQDELIAFYEERLPKSLSNARSLFFWLAKASSADLGQLVMTAADARKAQAAEPDRIEYPGELEIAGVKLRLAYKFAPGAADDGINVQVPLGVLAGLTAEPFEWLVPGMLAACSEALLRSLPKRLRRSLAPVPDHVAEMLPILLAPSKYRQGSLTLALTDALAHCFGVKVNPLDWDPARVDDHLRVNFSVVGKRGRRLAQGRDLAYLQMQLLSERYRTGTAVRTAQEQQGLTQFPAQGVPQRLHLQGAEEQLVYPALAEVGDSVALVMCADIASATQHNLLGYPRLARLADAAGVRRVTKALRSNRPLGLHYAAFGSSTDLEDRVLNHMYWHRFFADEPLPVSREEFTLRLHQGSAGLMAFYQSYELSLAAALARRFDIVATLATLTSPAYRNTLADVDTQLQELFGASYPKGAAWARFTGTADFLRGVVYRLEHLQGRVHKEAKAIEKLTNARERLHAIEAVTGVTPAVEAVQFAMQQWRGLLFAEPLGLHKGMSDKKFHQRLSQLEVQAGVASVHSE